MSEYLAIKNWRKYQSLRSRGGWIKDYTDQEGDEDMGKLTLFERMVLQGIRRLRGKTGKNVPNNPRYIANSMHALITDRPHIRHAITTLISQHWVTLVESAIPLELEPENREQRVEKREKPSRSASPASDSRFSEFVLVLHRYHAKFAGSLTFAVWFGNRGGKQLKNLLKAEPGLDLKTFEQAVAVRARSPGVDHSQPVFEWLAHVLTKPRGANGPGQQPNRAQQREQASLDQLRRVAGGNSLSLQTPVSDGNGGLGVSRLAGNVEPVRTPGSSGSNEPAHAKSAKAAAT